MRCYRIDEDVFQGIPLSMGPSGLLHIEVGTSSIALEKSLSDRLLLAKLSVLEELKLCVETGLHKGVQLDDADKRRAARLLEEIAPQSIQLLYADVGNDSIVSETHRSRDALVLVETSPGMNGGLSFLSSSYDEHVSARGVHRRYRQEFPPPGVTVVGEGDMRQGSKCYLLRMVPHSSFRMERNGALYGEAPILKVTWTGRGTGSEPLQIYCPEHRRAS